jgi:voltage-gated potassium channel
LLERFRCRTHEILEKASAGDRGSRAFDLFIMALIVLNVVMVIVETVTWIEERYALVLFWAEVGSVVVFSIEYLLRVWSITVDPAYRRPILGRLAFALTALALVDLIAILPFYLPMLVTIDLRFVRAIRLFRLFRLFKMGRYVKSLQLLGAIIREKKEELYIVVFVLVIMLVLTSSMMYYVEHEAQPEAFSSIPASMWWGVVTLTTVGYGDMFPITPLGKLLGVVIAVLGIGMFALPAGILSSGFVEAIEKDRNAHRICPHCGEEIDRDSGVPT